MRMRFLVCMAVSVALTGCATSGKNIPKLDVQRLQVQISNLETELKQKDEEIKGLKSQLENDGSAEKVSSGKTAGVSARPTYRNIQKTLKNAGLYTGPIDGKIGKETKKAIKAFQENNGLIVDGIVGKKTWAELEKYLN